MHENNFLIYSIASYFQFAKVYADHCPVMNFTCSDPNYDPVKYHLFRHSSTLICTFIF